MRNSDHANSLRDHAGASVAELQDFINQLKGKSPQEAMGLVTQNGLMRSTAVATIATLMLIGGFTAGPMTWRALAGTKKPAEAVKAPDQAEQQPAAEQKSPETGEKPGATPVASQGNDKKSDDPKKGDVLDKLGMSETKPASPKSNPLEKSSDDLLKDLK